MAKFDWALEHLAKVIRRTHSGRSKMADTKQCPICGRQFWLEYPAQKFCYKAGCETKKDNPTERIKTLEAELAEVKEQLALDAQQHGNTLRAYTRQLDELGEGRKWIKQVKAREVKLRAALRRYGCTQHEIDRIAAPEEVNDGYTTT